MADVAQKDAKVNIEIAHEQKKLADANTRDSATMKGISLLGAIFLPGTFLASVFSTTFFNFETVERDSVSRKIWIYFAFTIPLTVIVMLRWLWWDHVRRLVQRCLVPLEPWWELIRRVWNHFSFEQVWHRVRHRSLKEDEERLVDTGGRDGSMSLRMATRN